MGAILEVCAYWTVYATFGFARIRRFRSSALTQFDRDQADRKRNFKLNSSLGISYTNRCCLRSSCAAAVHMLGLVTFLGFLDGMSLGKFGVVLGQCYKLLVMLVKQLDLGLGEVLDID